MGIEVGAASGLGVSMLLMAGAAATKSDIGVGFSFVVASLVLVIFGIMSLAGGADGCLVNMDNKIASSGMLVIGIILGLGGAYYGYSRMTVGSSSMSTKSAAPAPASDSGSESTGGLYGTGGEAEDHSYSEAPEAAPAPEASVVGVTGGMCALRGGGLDGLESFYARS